MLMLADNDVPETVLTLVEIEGDTTDGDTGKEVGTARARSCERIIGCPSKVGAAWP